LWEENKNIALSFFPSVVVGGAGVGEREGLRHSVSVFEESMYGISILGSVENIELCGVLK